MSSSEGLHAIMDRLIVEGRSRVVKQTESHFFYNPMWSHFGDFPTSPSGTYFFNNSGHVLNYYWNIFDQVLIRPELLPYFEHDDLLILTNAGEHSLLDTNGRPSKDYSDHLPILFNLNLMKGEP